MKRKKIYLFAGIMVIVVSIILFTVWLLNRPCGEWEKPANVPVSAVWKGGCDGGNWIEFINIRTDTIRFRIYHDWTGNLELDADFVYENCTDLQLTEANWSEHITFFDGIKLYTNFLIDRYYCRLVPVFPAYYGKKVE